MNGREARREIDKIASRIGNFSLASAIHKSVRIALDYRPKIDLGGNTLWEVFESILKTATYKIREDKRGQLFQRLLSYGPPPPDAPELLVSDNETILSDPECGKCVQLIFSHMVNKFKGDLAELLALEPCISLVKSLQSEGVLPLDTRLFWGKMIKEPYLQTKKKTSKKRFGLGADGLIVEKLSGQNEGDDSIRIYGIVEVKSMRKMKPVLDQIDKHQLRLKLGLRLGTSEYSEEAVLVNKSDIFGIMVIPALWKLGRNMKPFEESNTMTSEMNQETIGTPVETQILKLSERKNTWRITLSWSQEALEEAAYNMTFWYMAQVGKEIYTKMDKPWKDMTSGEAGQNAFIMMLYYLPLRYLTSKQEHRAIKLYNIHGFGYPLGIDYAKKHQMIWSREGKLEGVSIPQKKKKKGKP